MNASFVDYLKQMKAFGLKENIPNVSETMGRFLNMLIKLRRPKTILEIGTANGYSTAWMAEAARLVNAVITGIDFSLPTSAQFRDNMNELGFDDIVSLVEGDALEVIPRLKVPATFDFVFVDGQKRQYWDFWLSIESRLSSNAIVVFDDMMAFSEKTHELQKNIEGLVDIDHVLIPVDKDDGCLLVFKS